MAKDISIKDLKNVLDEQTISDIAEQYAGCRILIPKKKSMVQFESIEDRNRYMWNMYFESGRSYQEIAEKVDLNPDSVKRILLGMVKDYIRK